MGHPALATFSTIGNFKHHLRVATIIQSKSEPIELLFNIFSSSLFKIAWVGHFRGHFWVLFVAFIDFVSFIICNISLVINTNLLYNAIFHFLNISCGIQKFFLLFQFFAHCDHLVITHFIHLNHLFAVAPSQKK